MIKKTNRSSQLVELITKNPGIQFRQIMRESGLKNGVLSHYLGKLEANGIVQVERGPRQTRFFTPNISEQETKIIKALRRQTPRDIMVSLITNMNTGLQFSKIVSDVKKSPSTVSLYLSQLVADNIVKVKLVETKKNYFIADRFAIDKLIEDYHPGLIEKPVDGFEDMVNSL